MERPLEQLWDLQKKHNCPIICCGDIFDHWNAPAETINFALQKLPFMYAVPGQHDLPHHSYDNIKQSAYWTLVKAGRIKNLRWGNPEVVLFEHDSNSALVLHGFPWGTEITKRQMGTDDPNVHLAVVHSYIWITGHSYPNAPKEKRAGEYFDSLKGFTAAAFGDNHKGFLSTKGPCPIFNCGTLMRRKADEFSYEPQVGLLYTDGHFEPHLLTTASDQFIDVEEALSIVERTMEGVQFVEELMKLGNSCIDYAEAVTQFCEKNGINKRVRKVISRLSEEK